MNKSKELKDTTEIVKFLLRTVPETRNSDQLLYCMVCSKKNSVALGKPFSYVLLNLKELNLPPFESVRRTRQKLQAAYPELAGCDKVEEQRLLNEEAFLDYARSVKV